MTSLFSLFDTEISKTIGLTIIHSLWQGVVIGLILMLCLQLIRKKSAKLKYLLGTSGMFLLLLVSIVTFMVLLPDQGVESSKSNLILSNISAESGNIYTSSEVYITNLNTYLPFVVIVWFLGIVLFSAKLTGAYFYTIRIKKRSVRNVSDTWRVRFEILRLKLHVSKSVKFLQSAYVSVPMVIGYLKPVVLIPVSMFAGVPESQLEAIIAHELAHIKRHDYLIHIIQSVIEVLFFYHPLVWWISSVVNEEREHICDDIAVSVCGESLTLAKALTTMETIRQNNSELAMAFNGKKNKLFNRVKRVLTNQGDVSYVNRKVLFSAIFILGFIFSQIIFNDNLIAQNKSQEENLVEVKELASVNDFNPDVFSIYKDSNGKDYKETWSIFPKDSLKIIKEKKKNTAVLNGENVDKETLDAFEDDLRRTLEESLDRINDFDSEELKNKQKEFEAQFEKQLEYFNSEEFTKNFEHAKENFQKQLQYFQSDEYKKHMQDYLEEIESYYNSKEFEEQQKEFSKKSAELIKKYKLWIDTIDWDNHADQMNKYLEENQDRWQEMIEEFEIRILEKRNYKLEELEFMREDLMEKEEQLLQKLEELESNGEASIEEKECLQSSHEALIQEQEALKEKQEAILRLREAEVQKREVLKELREVENEKRNAELKARKAEQGIAREKELELRKEEMKLREKELEQRKIEFQIQKEEFKKHEAYLIEVKAELLKDGLIANENENFTIELNTNELKVNKEIQSKKLHQKYLKTYKKFMGNEPKDTHKITINN